jgi:hypothetical protein
LFKKSLKRVKKNSFLQKTRSKSQKPTKNQPNPNLIGEIYYKIIVFAEKLINV